MSERHQNQRDKILALLQAAGPRGVSNLVLNEVAFRFGGRLLELRKDWQIETKRESDGIFRFIFRGKKRRGQQSLFQEVGAQPLG